MGNHSNHAEALEVFSSQARLGVLTSAKRTGPYGISRPGREMVVPLVTLLLVGHIRTMSKH